MKEHRHVKKWKRSGLFKKGPFCWWHNNCLNPTEEPHFAYLWEWKYCLSCNTEHWWNLGLDPDWHPDDANVSDPAMLRARQYLRRTGTTTRKVL